MPPETSRGRPGRPVDAPGPAGPLADLAAVLREERAMILGGAWSRLGALGPRKAAGLGALASAGEGAPPLPAALAAELARNQALLGAALEGFRDAATRRAMLGAARAGLTTYDAQGARAGVAPPRSTVERRA